MKRFTTPTKRSLRPLLALMILVLTTPARPADFPGGVTPNDAFASIELLDRVVDEIIQARGVTPPPAPPFDEVGLGPFHAYQMVVASTSRVQRFADTVGAAPLPTLVVSPRQYAPRDVTFIADMMAENLRAAGASIGLADLPADKQAFTGKTPQDVFRRAMDVFLKLNALEALRELRAQPRLVRWPRLLSDGIAQDAPYLLFHAVAVPARAPGEPLFHVLLNIAYNQLRHRAPPSCILIS